jgi:hypothetical protein
VLKGYLISLVIPPEKNNISATLLISKTIGKELVVAVSDVCG